LGQVFVGIRSHRPTFGQETDLAGELAAIRGCAMVLLRHIAIAAAACAAASLPVLADDQKPPPAQPVYTPRLNNIMILTQLGHFKLWYAGAVQNWPLANYELEQIRASISIAKTLYPDSDKSNMDTMRPAAEDLDKAIRAKDAASFTSAYSKLTAACNNCHEATGFGFIKIRVPRLSPIETSPFSDESFSGK
jgi:cytochrome c553